MGFSTTLAQRARPASHLPGGAEVAPASQATRRGEAAKLRPSRNPVDGPAYPAPSRAITARPSRIPVSGPFTSSPLQRAPHNPASSPLKEFRRPPQPGPLNDLAAYQPNNADRLVEQPEYSEVHAVLRSAGERLEPGIRRMMETLMAREFSQVRLHTGLAAAESARAVGAAAFTVGKHIVFGFGQYAPATERGRALLRHELAHTIQQPDVEPPSSLQHTDPGDRFEVEAERAGRGQAPGGAMAQRTALPMLAREPIAGTGRPSTASYRGISITIGGSPAGQAVTWSYPVWDGKYYVVPLYNVTVTGSDDAGTVVTKTFKALRFGVYRDPNKPVGASKATGPFVAGRAAPQEYTAGFRADYDVHSAESHEPGAWDLNGGFLIHDGPDFP